MPIEPLSEVEARAFVRAILSSGSISFSRHARKRMKERQLSAPDVANVLRGGWSEPAELSRGSWRYRIVTHTMAVVVVIRSETELRVVSVWRIEG